MPRATQTVPAADTKLLLRQRYADEEEPCSGTRLTVRNTQLAQYLVQLGGQGSEPDAIDQPCSRSGPWSLLQVSRYDQWTTFGRRSRASILVAPGMRKRYHGWQGDGPKSSSIIETISIM